MKPSKLSRREVLNATGATLAGMAVAAMLPASPSSFSEGSPGQTPAVEQWLLKTGQPHLNPGLYRMISSAIRARSA